MDINIKQAISMGKRFRVFNESRKPEYFLDRLFRGEFTKPLIKITPNYLVVHPNLSPEYRAYDNLFVLFWVGYIEPQIFEDKVADLSIFDLRKSERYA